MNNDEALAQLRAVREAVTRITRDVDAAITHLEAFQPVAEAFQRRQAAVQLQWEDLMRAGGPDNLDIEAQTHHATEVRAAEVSLMSALKGYLATAPQEQETGSAPDEHPPEAPNQEHHPY